MADAVNSLLSRMSALEPIADPEPSSPPPVELAASADVDKEEPVEEEQEESRSDLRELLEDDIKVTLADQQQDPNSPLFSIKSFEELNLNPNLLKGIYKMGYQKPSRIQERSLPLLLSDPPVNMIGQSQSGTGKTAAFALTMLSRINMDLNKPQAICIAPSRELALQILSVVERMGEYTPVKAFHAGKDSFIKGMSRLEQQIIIGTPGTIIDLVVKQRILDLTEVKVFVLDEADNMLDSGTMAQQSTQVKSLITKFSKSTQILLFSATFADLVRNFAIKFAPNANQISVKDKELNIKGIKQFFMDCEDEAHKYEILVELYNLLTIGQSIIFVGRRDTADEIAARMTNQGHKVVSLHGKLETAERDSIMNSFREGKSKVLITTNVIARGIDIPQVNLVINYDLPLDANRNPDKETYLHRIGRTGRFGRAGVAINFVHDAKSFENMEAIKVPLGIDITSVGTGDFEQMEITLKAALKA